jgi:hypothetical protein
MATGSAPKTLALNSESHSIFATNFCNMANRLRIYAESAAMASREVIEHRKRDTPYARRDSYDQGDRGTETRTKTQAASPERASQWQNTWPVALASFRVCIPVAVAGAWGRSAAR